MQHELRPVMLFSGKGGVGKTTLAAATAVRAARAGSRVLLVSTDPAHSLSDVLGVTLGAEPRTVIPHLDAIELDAHHMFSSALAGDAAASGPMGKLFELASRGPGVDELGAIEVLLHALQGGEHDVVILDTAPTGHTLRLLMLPELLDGWLGTLLELRGQLARAGRLLRRFLPRRDVDAALDADLERGLSGGRERITALRDHLRDPQRAQIFLVTIAEPMSVAETLRTLDVLHEQHLAVGAIIVNQLQPENPTCAHCQHRRTVHQREVDTLRQRAGAPPLRLLESQSHEIHGPEALLALADRLWEQPS